jgi:hypothetical protein
MQAIGACSVCREPVCLDHLVRVDGAVLCYTHFHQMVRGAGGR